MNWLDIIIVLCLAVGLIKGLFDGFVKQVMSFVALLAAIFFAGQLAVPAKTFLVAHVSISPLLLSGLCYVLAFVLILVLISLLGKWVSLAIKMTPVRPLDMLLGAVFGVMIWAFSLSILLNILYTFHIPLAVGGKSATENSRLYEPVKRIVPTVYPKLRDYFKN